MFHEILLCLSGVPNTLQDTLSNCSELEDIMHPAEVKLLDRVLEIAKDYSTIKNFVESNLYDNNCFAEQSDAATNRVESGWYVKAFCESLHQSLEPYRKDLISIEAQFHNEPDSQTITSMLFTFDRHHPLLMFMVKIINEISEQKIHGFQILSLVYEHALFGPATIKVSMRRAVFMCHKILIKQLKSWFFNGTLHDPHEEFFIRCVKTVSGDANDVTLPSLLNSTAMSAMSMVMDSDNQSVVKEYEINIAMLKSYLPVRLANKILYIGETILTLSSDIDANGMQIDHNCYGEQEEDLRSALDSVLQPKLMLNVLKLEKIVDDFKICVTKYLWTLVIHRADLYAHLTYMKDIFLLGYGVFFVEFLEQAGPKLQRNMSCFAAQNLNHAFVQSARNVGVDENLIAKFNFTVVKNMNELLFTQMFLNYKPDWPLQLLFTPPVVQNYNALFKFLLRLKTVQLDLHQIWLHDIKQKTKGIPPTWRLRTQLMHFLENLQYYLQVDVIESEYALLLTAVRNSLDFEQIQVAHIEFHANLLSKAFIYAEEPTTHEVSSHSINPISTAIHPIKHRLSSILNIGETFCRLANTKSRDMSSELSSLSTELDETLSDLILLMCELRRIKSRTNQIDQFLVRLDYNKWYTKEVINK